MRLASLILILLGPPASSQELDPFSAEESAGLLETALAEMRLPGAFSLRWRAQAEPGQPARLYQRLEWRGAPQEGYLLTERDPGESRWADFAAFYLKCAFRPLEVVAGDLRPGFGQGLVFSRSPGGRGLQLPALRQDSQELGYRASAENAALRGLAMRGRVGPLEGALVAGWMRRDARVDARGRVTSLPESGLHITPRERAGHLRLRAWAGGLRLRCLARNWQAGTTLQELRFDHLVDLRRKNSRAFHGRNVHLGSADGNFQWKGLRLGGEGGMDARGRKGIVGVAAMGFSSVKLGAGWRHYDPEFPAFFGGALGHGDTRDERGFSSEAGGRWGAQQWQVFADRYAPVQAPHPSTLVWGLGLARPLWPGLRLELSGQQQEEQTERSRRARVNLDWQPFPSLEFAARLEGRRLRRQGRKTEQGGMVSWRATGCWEKVEWTFHASRFSTPSYATRIYEFERDLPGALSIRPLYGEGWRFYLLAERPWRSLRLAGRYRYQEGEHHCGVQVDLISPAPQVDKGRAPG